MVKNIKKIVNQMTSIVEPKNPSDDHYRSEALIEMTNFSFSYDLGKTNSLKEVNLKIPKNRVTALIGPSGCGKTTLLRCINRLNDSIPTGLITKGTIKMMGTDINAPQIDPTILRREVGMVFQKSNPFPKSIYDNVAFGLRLGGKKDKEIINQRVEESLKAAALWEEVKDRLKDSALDLSSGQQQRLCLARTIAIQPSVMLLDEPCSALDPTATRAIEELITKLRETHTIVIVTHNVQQAPRVSDYTAFLHLGELIEFGMTSKLFTNPSVKQTEDFITGRFG
jgi:phosphate transport system ATP-binding protein